MLVQLLIRMGVQSPLRRVVAALVQQQGQGPLVQVSERARTTAEALPPSFPSWSVKVVMYLWPCTYLIRLSGGASDRRTRRCWRAWCRACCRSPPMGTCSTSSSARHHPPQRRGRRSRSVGSSAEWTKHLLHHEHLVLTAVA